MEEKPSKHQHPISQYAEKAGFYTALSGAVIILLAIYTDFLKLGSLGKDLFLVGFLLVVLGCTVFLVGAVVWLLGTSWQKVKNRSSMAKSTDKLN